LLGVWVSVVKDEVRVKDCPTRDYNMKEKGDLW